MPGMVGSGFPQGALDLQGPGLIDREIDRGVRTLFSENT